VDLCKHYCLMAQYNRRLNQQVYACCEGLSHEELHRDRKAFFGSLIGTLNHILVGDIIWLQRLRQHSDAYKSLALLDEMDQPYALNHILYSEFACLVEARVALDDAILLWLENDVSAQDLDRDLHYSNSKDIVSERNFGELLAHFFNHQTHHRGQISTLLSQLGLDIGPTDFLIDIPDALRSSSP
jgi:uncharacterized damage-inducible protein DinB